METENPIFDHPVLDSPYACRTRRLDGNRADDGKPEEWDVHHWQNLNPPVCEGLVQTTLGGPQPVYHGGLLHCRLRWFDAGSGRPGLPDGVAALVRHADADGVDVELVNVDPLAGRRVVAQAGACSEHAFTRVSTDASEAATADPHIIVALGPASGGRVRLGKRRFVGRPTYARPAL